jgi:Holliday junction resolvase RuvX-like protein
MGQRRLMNTGGGAMSSRWTDIYQLSRAGFPGELDSYLSLCIVLKKFMIYLQQKPRMRILAFDYGTKRIGIAVTDPLQIIATGLDTIHPKDIRLPQELSFERTRRTFRGRRAAANGWHPFPVNPSYQGLHYHS